MIIGMNWRLAPNLTAQDQDRSVRQYLVRIHIGLSAATSLEDNKGEVRVELSRDDFVGRVGDGIGNLGIHLSDRCVVQSTALLHRRHGVYDGKGHFGLWSTDGEVLDRSLRLSSPQFGRRYNQLPHTVALSPRREGCRRIIVS